MSTNSTSLVIQHAITVETVLNGTLNMNDFKFVFERRHSWIMQIVYASAYKSFNGYGIFS